MDSDEQNFCKSKFLIFSSLVLITLLSSMFNVSTLFLNTYSDPLMQTQTGIEALEQK